MSNSKKSFKSQSRKAAKTVHFTIIEKKLHDLEKIVKLTEIFEIKELKKERKNIVKSKQNHKSPNSLKLQKIVEFNDIKKSNQIQ